MKNGNFIQSSSWVICKPDKQMSMCLYILPASDDGSCGGSSQSVAGAWASAEEVIAEFAKFDMNEFEEVVFCGFGEPTEALPVLLKVAAYVKETFSKPVRINTNGMGNLNLEPIDITTGIGGWWYSIHQPEYTECRALPWTGAQQIRRSVLWCNDRFYKEVYQTCT